uniref:B1340F09.10 protein n=1 Tax=Oryza sativa subsp. japonica TaxID=39947 RepID=Q6MW73_ORYSJ|nr:B1340F09.10 [Oryza sativa Japonica Group]
MGDNLDDAIDKRLKALEEIEKEKKRVAKACNKRVKVKLFQVRDLILDVYQKGGGMCLHPDLAPGIELGNIAKIWEICRFPP